jgi:Uma2 family endonuclease
MTAPVLQRSDEFARRSFSVDEVFRMIDAGILDPSERLELIEGELIVMPAEKFAHARAATTIARRLFRELADNWFVGMEKTLQLGPGTFVEPDFFVCPADQARCSGEGLLTVSGPELFIIEVADSSLRHDRTRKAALYAIHGVREYWIVDLNGRRIVVHHRPEEGQYREVTSLESGKAAVPEPPGPSAFRLRIEELD